MQQETVHFRDLVPIDISRLDEEWLRHPILFNDLAEACEDASFTFEAMKNQLEEVESRLNLEIREDPEKFDAPINVKMGAPSESTIAALIRVQPSYLAAKKDLLRAEHVLGRLKMDMRVMEHRKTALEELVKLHGQNYFSSPRGCHAAEQPNIKEMQAKFRTAIIRERRLKRLEDKDNGSDE